jgi:hypothetical protein
MKRLFSLGSATVLSLTLLGGTPSFGKGAGHGHSGGHAHSGGSGHSHGTHSGGGHAHSSGHPSGEHHSSAHATPSHSAHPQMAHNPPAHPQTHSHPTHPQPSPAQGTPQHVAGQNSTSNQTFTHTGGGWHHDHHSGWSAWGGGVALPWDYDPYWNGPPGVVVVPQETNLVEQEYVTRVTPPAAQPASSQNPPLPSQNTDGTDSAQVNTAP